MPPRRRREKTQTSMLQFTTKPTRKPSAKPLPSQPSQRPALARALPPPTIPPVFRTPEAPKRPRSIGSSADEAFDMAEQIIYGRRRTAHVRCSDNGGGGTQSVSDDDDDFEPDTIRASAAAERPSARKKARSQLRNDRASMTRPSSTNRVRPRQQVRIATQRVAGDRSRSANGTPLASGLDRLRPSPEGDIEVCDVVVLDGAKSELSATDEESDTGSLGGFTPGPSPKKTRLSLTTSAVAPADLEEHEPKNRRPSPETPEDYLRRIKLTRSINSSRVACESTEKPDSNARRKEVNSAQAAAAIASAPSCIKRTVGVLTNVFASDSDELVLSSSTNENSERDASDEVESDCHDKRVTEDESAGEENYQTPPVGRTRIATRSATRKAARKKVTKRASPVFVRSDTDEETPTRGHAPLQASLVGTPRLSSPRRKIVRRRIELSDESASDDELREVIPSTPVPVQRSTSKARKLSLPSETTPSPPSTKKRRPLQRLIACYSDEEPVVVVDERSKEAKVPQERPSVSRTSGKQKLASDNPSRSTEWFHERDIGDFSSSSAEFGEPVDTGTMPASPSKARRAAPQSRLGPVLPVRRDILKSFSDEPEEPRENLSNSHESSSDANMLGQVAHPASAKGRTEISEPDREQDLAAEETPVIDLVESEEDRIRPIESKDSEYPSGDCIRSLGSVPEMDSQQTPMAMNLGSVPVPEPGAPPPFNLIVLCNPGESVRAMRDRLGEGQLIAKIVEAQKDGREIIGGEELGLTKSFNRGVFNSFSKTVIADEIGHQKKAKFVTEQAMRGEYKFHYRGRDQPRFAKRGKRKSAAGTASRGNGRLANLRRRRYGS